jgi:CubicO group peptidase (beta-lactamase class C family)
MFICHLAAYFPQPSNFGLTRRYLTMRLTRKFRLLGSILLGAFVLIVAIVVLVYNPVYVFRTIVWQESDAFDWQKFPSHPLQVASTTYHFDTTSDPRVEQLFEQLSGAEDWNSFLEENKTQAFIVIKDGHILYENYFNNTQRDSIVTSFSVAKSFTSALIGIAVHEGYIKSIDEPITVYLPELAERDPRFNEITIRHLLLMASGLDYQESRPWFLASDDTLTTYYPDQRKISLENTNIIDAPGQHFSYNKYHPQLLGMILERTTGMPVTSYLQTRIWNVLGMEYGGSWSIDSEASDFEKMESGVNARAIDFAKFGVLFLNGGNWNGNQVIPESWVDESTKPLLLENYADYYPAALVASFPGQVYYKYMWWGMARGAGSYDFAALGDKGQYIYMSPQKNLVIVRNGIEYGIPSKEWLKLFFQFASEF